MIILSQQEISATPKGADKLSPEQVAQLMPQLPEWTIITIDTIEQLYSCLLYTSDAADE